MEDRRSVSPQTPEFQFSPDSSFIYSDDDMKTEDDAKSEWEINNPDKNENQTPIGILQSTNHNTIDLFNEIEEYMDMVGSCS